MKTEKYTKPLVEVLDACAGELLLTDSVRAAGLDEGEALELTEEIKNAWISAY